jgi:hypothetical protein
VPPYLFGEALDVLPIKQGMTLGSTVAGACPCLGIRNALLLGSGHCGFLNEQPLTLITLPAPAELYDDRTELRILASSSSEGCIASRQKH